MANPFLKQEAINDLFQFMMVPGYWDSQLGKEKRSGLDWLTAPRSRPSDQSWKMSQNRLEMRPYQDIH